MLQLSHCPVVLVALCASSGCVVDGVILADGPEQDRPESSARVSSAGFEPERSDLLATAPGVDLGGSWIYPLAGDKVLPEHPSRLFGAARPGGRPWECGRGHCGIDLGNQLGTVVYAMSGGTVVVAERTDRGRAGRYVRIRHPGGIRTDYLHLDRIRADLHPGRRVAAGEAIGTVGRTGVKFSGPHLHFAVAKLRASQWEYLDPEPLLRQAWAHQGARSLATLAQRNPEQAIDWETNAQASGALVVDVRDHHSSRSLSGVRVRATGPGGTVTQGIARGSAVKLSGLVPGRWRLSVARRGYTSVRETIEVTALGRGMAAPAIRIDLRQGAILRGVVRDADGERVVGAQVSAGAVTAVTDRQGAFQLKDVDPSEHELWASYEGQEGVEALRLSPGDELVTLQVRID